MPAQQQDVAIKLAFLVPAPPGEELTIRFQIVSRSNVTLRLQNKHKPCYVQNVTLRLQSKQKSYKCTGANMDQKELVSKINAIDDNADKHELKRELENIFTGMQMVSEGFLRIAQAANRMKEKKLYRHLGFNTFEIFCRQIIGLTRKQVSLYIRIAEITEMYNDIFDERFVLSMGPTKMDEINKGIDKIENSNLKKRDKRKNIEKLLTQLNPGLTVAETEKIVKECTNYL